MPSKTDNTFLSTLTPNAAVADFGAEAIYDDDADRPMGARMRHRPSGFILDVLRMQSVPQVFLWVNTAPPSQRGEPHTCEHLLLGKGRRGRAHASLEEMSLGESSAFTMQTKTCYHIHTASGSEVFFGLLESQLHALVHPDFSDEEIRREVCHLGPVTDPATGTVTLEEKGTVYSEMISTYEHPWTFLSNELGLLLYGEDHPLARDSGGRPDAIRTMTPDHLRRFHGDAYRISNMGMILCLPDEVSLEEGIEKVSGILERVEPDARTAGDPATADDRLPEPIPAAAGTTRSGTYPSHNPDAPSELVFAFAPISDLEPEEAGLLGLFVANLASGETSILHSRFVDSAQRVIETGASAAFGWVDDSCGHSVHIGLRNVDRDTTEREKADQVATIVRAEIERIASLPGDSDELAEFNKRGRGRLIQSRRAARHFLNTPPGFGYRSAGAGWMAHLDELRKIGGFRRSLAMKAIHDRLELLLAASRGNAWRDRLRRWGLVGVAPYAVSVCPDPRLLEKERIEKENRLQSARVELDARFEAEGEDSLRLFREEYDLRSDEIDSSAESIEMPRFVDDPPMTIDDHLQYSCRSICGVPTVESVFDHMSGATVGLAFRLDRVSQRRRFIVSSLASLLLDVGVIDNGKPISHTEMTEALRREIWGLVAYYSSSSSTSRVELVIKGAGTRPDENERAMHWLRLGLFHPDWRAENLSRIRDVIDGDLAATRATPRGAEEGWVGGVELSWRRQSDPLQLGLNSYAAQTYDLLRLRWLLRDDPGGVADFVRELGEVGEPSRESLTELLASLTEEGQAGESGRWAAGAQALDARGRAMLREACDDLGYCMTESPDASLALDWGEICATIATELCTPPANGLRELEEALAEIRHRDNLRLFTVGDEPSLTAIEQPISAIIGELTEGPSAVHEHSGAPHIVARLRARGANEEDSHPLHIGVVNASTSTGVIVHTAPCGRYADLGRDQLLDFLATRLYGGGGAHSLFMKTWSAGLAYSNGLRDRPAEGRLAYYAERCPDLAQTIRFVIAELSTADPDPSLAEYAVAQTFSESRAGAHYSLRGEAMAADLTDGRLPGQVRAYRKAILRLRDELGPPALLAELKARIEGACARVLPGLGDAPPPAGACYVVIGPESQMESYETYLKSTDANARLHRVHPRDFWITGR